MKRILLNMLLGLCSFSLNYALYYYQGDNEKGVQPSPVVIVVNLPGTPQRPVLPPNSPKPTRLTLLSNATCSHGYWGKD